MKIATGNSLKTVEEMAKILGVPKSWLYQRTRLGVLKLSLTSNSENMCVLTRRLS